MAHLLHPGLVPDLLEGILRAGLEVVGEAQGVAHLVGHHVGQEVAHEVIGQPEPLGPLVQRGDLGEVPVPLELQDVVVEHDVRLQDLSGAGVADVGAVGVGHGRGHPADDGVARIAGIEVRILLGGGGELRHDGLLEAGSLEGGLPGFHALLHEGHPGLRGGAVDVKGDGLHGLAEGRGGVLLLQAPAGDVGAAAGLVVRSAVVGVPHAEEAQALVRDAGEHRLLRQLHEREEHGYRATGAGPQAGGAEGAGAAGCGTHAEGHAVGLYCLDVQVCGKGLDLVQVASRGIEGLGTQELAGAELRHFRGEQARRLDDRGAVLGEGLHGKAHQDGVPGGGGHGLRHGLGGICHQGMGDLLQQHAVLLHHPPHHGGVHHAACMVNVGRGLVGGDHQQQLLAQAALGDLEVGLALELVDLDEALLGLGFGGDDLVIGLGLAGIRHRRGRAIGPGRGGRCPGRGRLLRGALRHQEAGGQSQGEAGQGTRDHGGLLMGGRHS